MRIELGAPPPAPEWPRGLRVVPFDPDRDALEFHVAEQEAFAGHWDYSPRDFEEWASAASVWASTRRATPARSASTSARGHDARPRLGGVREAIGRLIRPRVYTRPMRAEHWRCSRSPSTTAPTPAGRPRCSTRSRTRACARRSSCSASGCCAHPELLERVLAAGHDVRGAWPRASCATRTLDEQDVAADLDAALAALARPRRRAGAVAGPVGPSGAVHSRRSRQGAGCGSRAGRSTRTTGGAAAPARCSPRSHAAARTTAGSCSRTTASARARCASDCEQTAALIGPLVAAARARAGSSPGR